MEQTPKTEAGKEAGSDYADDDFYEEESFEIPDKNGFDYSDDLKEVFSKADKDKFFKSCSTIDGPGEGSSCIFPFQFEDESHTTCTLAGDSSVHQFWCSTQVDSAGVHVSGQWGACSKECPGVEKEGFIEKKCDSAESGTECQIPFSYKGFTYHGCVREQTDFKYWCVVINKTEAGKTFR